MNPENIWMRKYLGERFMFYRSKKGYSRDDVAKFIGVAKRTFEAYERGEREPSIDQTKKLASIYQITFNRLTDYKNVCSKMRADMKESGNNIDRAVL